MDNQLKINLNLILDFIKSNNMTNDATFNLLNRNIKIKYIDFNSNTVFFEAPNSFLSNIINRRHIPILKDAILATSNDNYNVVVKSSDEYLNNISSFDKVTSNIPSTSTYSININNALPEENIFNPNYTFNNFICGEINRYVFSICESIAKYPNKAEKKPLFLYGKSGLGKTHLINAIGIYLLEHTNNLRIVYVNSETLTNDYVDAVTKNNYSDFRLKYRNTDVLLIDDIQFLEGKDHLQTEFFHTFESLTKENKQIILTSDKKPHNLSKLNERLRSRFGQGVVSELKAPDYETRIAILTKKANNKGIEIDQTWQSIFSLIAENFKKNVRDLEGTFNQIVDFSTTMGIPVTIEFAKSILKDRIVNTKNTITPEKIKLVVSQHYKITTADLNSASRKKKISDPRQIAMYLCRTMTDYSFEQIGNIFNRHYTTVLDACKKIEDLQKTDENLKNVIIKLRNDIEKN